jgi:hypothetical protein
MAVLSIVLAGCPWSAITQGEGEAAIDDSAEAMVGTYRIGDRSEASDGCETLAGEDGESDQFVHITEIDEGERADEQGDGGRLRIALCEAPDDCADPVWEVTATKVADGGAWRAREGEASAADGPAWKRSCRMQVTTTRAVPEREGMRIERREQRGGVALEGDTACRNSTAVEYVDQLRCVRQTVWEGEVVR